MKIKPGVFWPAVIAGALALHVIAMMANVWISTSNDSYAVEPDYYQKALHWDDKRAQDRRNAELGWRLEFRVKPADPGRDPVLEVELVSGDNAPVTDAAIAVETFANVRRDDVLRATLSPTRSGYHATLPIRRDGLWEFRFTVTRGEDVFTYRDVRHVWTEADG